MKKFILLITLLISTLSYSQTYIGKAKEINKILKNIDAFSQFYMNKEYNHLANCYTENGKIFPNNANIISGKDAIKKRWTLPENVSVTFHKIHPTEIKIIKNYAYDFGYYEGSTKKADGSIVSWKGKYVIVWKKVKKDWKIYLDIWNRVNE